MEFDDVRGASDRTSNGGGGIATRISSSVFIRRGFDIDTTGVDMAERTRGRAVTFRVLPGRSNAGMICGNWQLRVFPRGTRGMVGITGNSLNPGVLMLSAFSGFGKSRR
jgi:hypothetical protein